MMKGRNSGNFSNSCLTMHQPWASLLIYGIKRIEGRSWPSSLRGRLWIHAAGKVPEESTIKAMEDFYREIYALDGITDLKFPEHYPVSRLLGCVEVTGCVRGDELKNWDKVPEGVRLEAQTDFCWLCEQPQKLLVPFEMRGYKGVYNLEKKIFEAAVRGLTRVKCPLPVKFQLPDPRDPFSLKPGSVSSRSSETRGSGSEVEKSSKLNSVIAGARAAATQFSRKYQDPQTSVQDYTTDLGRADNSKTKFLGGDKFQSTNFHQDRVSRSNIEEQSSRFHPRSQARFAHQQQQNGEQSSSFHPRSQAHFAHQQQQNGEQSSRFHPRSQALFAHQQQQNGEQSSSFHPRSRALFAHQHPQNGEQSSSFHPRSQARFAHQQQQNGEQSSSFHPRSQARFAHQQQQNGEQYSSFHPRSQARFAHQQQQQNGEHSSSFHPQSQAPFAHQQQQNGTPSKIFTAALKGLR